MLRVAEMGGGKVEEELSEGEKFKGKYVQREKCPTSVQFAIFCVCMCVRVCKYGYRTTLYVALCV